MSHVYTVTKTYGHELGLSCAFRQWRASSHCNCMHGYALRFSIEYVCNTLDGRNWVIDFGALKSLKEHIQNAFDHTVAVAKDDPQYDKFIEMEKLGMMDCREFDEVGCEAFAAGVFAMATAHLPIDAGLRGLRVLRVTCSEHGANSATYLGETA